MLSNSQKLLLAFVTLILGAVLIGVIATQSIAVTAKTIVDDESHSITGCITGAEQQINGTADADCNITTTNAPTAGTWKEQDCPLSSITVFNTSAGTYTALIEGTDYNEFPVTGIIQMLNTTSTDAGDFNTTYLNYVYCGDDYLNSSWGRTVLNLVAGFFAIALLLAAVALFYDVARDNGIISR